MRRSAVWFLPATLILLLAALTACGGGHSTTVGPPATVSVSPTTASIDTGQVFGISTIVTDSKGNVVSNPPKITFTSSNTAIATVSAGGAVCGGAWDANNIVCTPGTPGTATITVASGSISATVSVFVHAHIDRLVITPPSVNCKSQGQTAQLTAQALSNGADVTSTVGPITWSSTQTGAATVDSNGLVTAVAPGQANVNASVGSINAVPALFVTCPVQSIRIHLPSVPDVAFSFASAATQQLAADVLDTAGSPVNVSLTWTSSQPVVASVSSSGLATAAQPGATSITATCFGTTCNIGLSTIYSNVVTATVTGSSANFVFATGTGTTSLVPIDTTTNTAAAAVTLPAQPNSLLVSPQGSFAFLGSSGGLMTLNTAGNTVTNDASHPGTVLAVSPDGNWVVVAGASSVFLVNTVTSSSTQTLNIAGATAAAFTPASDKLFIAAGTTLWWLIPGGSPVQLSEPAPLAGATVLASGGFGYFGSSTAKNVLAVASCNATPAGTVTTPGTPALVAALPNGNAILAADSPGIDVITPNTTLAGCPPPLTDAITTASFGPDTFTPRQLIVLPNSSKAYITSDLAKVLVYDVTGATAGSITLAGTGTTAFTGGATLDSASVYLGGSDNAVHRIDVASGTDATQIPLSFTPDLVAVRPK